MANNSLCVFKTNPEKRSYKLSQNLQKQQQQQQQQQSQQQQQASRNSFQVLIDNTGR